MQKIIKTLTRNINVTNLTSRRMLGVSILRYNLADPDEPVDIKDPFEKERKMCTLCKNNIIPDYKNVRLLSQFQSPYTGRIYGRHITGLCKQKQADVEKAIVKAQQCAMMPTYHKDLDFMRDPGLFDPEKPIKPHKY